MGLDQMQMIDSAVTGWLRALWAIGYDVALTNPDARRTIAALHKLEFVVVQDLFFDEIARECWSVFLPAASSFEKEGTFMNSEWRVQRVRQALAPPGEAKADWEIICDLARELGKREHFHFRSPKGIWDEIRTAWPAGQGMTHARLEQGGLQWPCPHDGHPGTAVLHRAVPSEQTPLSFAADRVLADQGNHLAGLPVFTNDWPIAVSFQFRHDDRTHA